MTDSMEVNYRFFSEAEQANMRRDLLAQIEREHYANKLAMERAKAMGNSEEIARFEETIVGLAKQHAALSPTVDDIKK